MKYIKSYNESTEVLYKKIDPSLFNIDNKIPFTQIELDIIKNMYQELELSDKYIWVFLSQENSICIYKVDDEYYYIYNCALNGDSSNDTFYKCDTFEGVIQCLKFLSGDKFYTKHNESNTEEYYVVLDIDEYEKFIFDEYEKNIEFTMSERESIKSAFSEVQNYLFFYHTGQINILNRVKKNGKTYWSRCCIYKYIDDWYYVDLASSLGHDYYRCDQLDGLIKLIQDKLS